MKFIKRLFPFFETVRNYSKDHFFSDLPAGVMVAILLVPQAIAYSYLAGMPPQYGLYTALLPCLIYSLMGTSPHLAIGPVAVSALLVLAGISQIAEPFSALYIEYVILAGLLIGIFQLIIGAIRLGSLVNLLSYPVITGFTSAASVIVIVSQMKDILGIEAPVFEYFHDKLFHFYSHINQVHTPTLIVGVVCFIFIYLLKKVAKKIPYGLVVVVLAISLSYFLDFEGKGIAVIGEVPSGLPSFSFPVITLEKILLVTPTVLIVTLIGIIEAVGIAKAIAAKHDYYKIRTNQELIALGSSKIVGSFFMAIPSSGSFSRSALLNESKAKTSVASIITVVFVILALLFMTPLLYHLPKVVLAVIIIYAVKNLFEYNLAKKLFKTHKLDFLVMFTTFILCVTTNIEKGILAGFILSLIVIMINSKSPLRELKRIIAFSPQHSYHSETKDDKLQVAVNGQLNFGNNENFNEHISEELKKGSIRKLVIDLEKVDDIDSTGIKCLKGIQECASRNKVDLEWVNPIKKVNKRLQKGNLR